MFLLRHELRFQCDDPAKLLFRYGWSPSVLDIPLAFFGDQDYSGSDVLPADDEGDTHSCSEGVSHLENLAGGGDICAAETITMVALLESQCCGGQPGANNCGDALPEFCAVNNSKLASEIEVLHSYMLELCSLFAEFNANSLNPPTSPEDFLAFDGDHVIPPREEGGTTEPPHTCTETAVHLVSQTTNGDVCANDLFVVWVIEQNCCGGQPGAQLCGASTSFCADDAGKCDLIVGSECKPGQPTRAASRARPPPVHVLRQVIRTLDPQCYESMLIAVVKLRLCTADFNGAAEIAGNSCADVVTFLVSQTTGNNSICNSNNVETVNAVEGNCCGGQSGAGVCAKGPNTSVERHRDPGAVEYGAVELPLRF